MKYNFLKGFLLLWLLSACAGDDARKPLFPVEENSSELFFSEYIYGSAYNNALEIVNLTGDPVNLAAEVYAVKKSDTQGNWVGELLLSGSIANNEVYVIANQAASHPDILNNASLLKAGSPMDYDRNDAIGLFKNGILIDIIGFLDDPEDLDKDISLRRKPEVTGPSAIYQPDQWELFEMDHVGDLGKY